MRAKMRHWAMLGCVVLLGVALRLWGLDHKPAWSDELVTWTLAGGHGVEDLVLGRPVAVDAALDLLQPRPSACTRVAASLARDSTHPPLFFCLMNPWLNAYPGAPDDLGARLRWLRLPAVLFGLLAILAVYWLGRVAASAPVGLLAAALAAVSPYAVYLSQEARHYSLPLALSAAGFALTIMLIRLRRSGPALSLVLWLAWVLVSLGGLYSHYLMGPAVAAQGLLLTLRRWRSGPRSGPALLMPAAALGLVVLGYAPWLPIQVAHLGRPETGWMALGAGWADLLLPLPRFFAGWITMFAALPVESSIQWMQIGSAIGMLAFAAGLLWVLVPGWRRPAGRMRVPHGQRSLAVLLLTLLAAYLVLIYGFGKDLSLAPRYAFVCYPIIVVLVAIGLCARVETDKGRLRRLLIPAVLLIGLIGSAVTVQDLMFRKPFDPARMAQSIGGGSAGTRLLVMGYDQPLQQWALLTSILLAVDHRNSDWRGNTRVSMVPMEILDQPLNARGLPWASGLELLVMAAGAGPGGVAERALIVHAPSRSNAESNLVLRCDAIPREGERVMIAYWRYRCEPGPETAGE